jgi:ABC-type transport system involved in multi-copper enzyme maturation permease subunit
VGTAIIGFKELTISWVSLLEAIRRKDIYVMLILSGLIIVLTGMFNAFGVSEIRKFMTDVSLSIINFFTIIITVLVSARQLPYEIEHRTLYPMLAKPIGRLQFLVGKFLGIMAMSTITLLIFFAVAAVVFAAFGIPLKGVFFQSVYFRWMSLFVISSMTLFLSLVFTHAANVTICLLLCIGASTFARTIVLVYNSVAPLQQKIITAAYWIFPHLDIFDLSKRVVQGWPPVSTWTTGAITIYALIYATIFLGLAYLRFRRQPL